MKKRLLTLLLVLVVVVGATATLGFAAGVETLTGNLDSKTITENTELNLNGYTIGTLTVEPGVTVTISGAGATGTITTIQGGGIVELADGFMLWGGAGNKLTLGTAGISLRADNLSKNGASVYYTSTFGGNAAVLEKIQAYGVAMYVGSSKNLFADNTFTRNEDLSGWDTNAVSFNDNGVLLKGILKTGNAYSVNKANATKQIYNVPYVELVDGTRITGATVNRSLQNVVEQVTAQSNPGSDFWDKNMNATQKTNVVNMYNTFSAFMGSWDMPRLEPLVDESKATAYPLYTVSDVQMMASKPNESYALMANIDMKGAAINGITGFTGSITGNGKTLSNVTVNGVGLVDTVAAGQTISNLHLRDVKVVVPAKSTAQYVGILAANNDGSVTGVTVTGSLKDTRAGTEDAKIYAGVFVGKNAGTVTAANDFLITSAASEEEILDVQGNSKNAAYVTSNLVADAGLWMSDTSDYAVRGGLVGTGNAATNAGSVYWRDRSYSTERQASAFQTKRQTVVDYVYESGTIKWTVPSTITYYNDQANYSATSKPSGFWGGMTSGSFHIHNQQFKAGTTYVGIPYTHCSSSLEQFKYYTQGGVLDSNIAKLVGGNKKSGNFITGYTYSQNAGDADWESGNISWAKYIGSDCSSALTVAWHKVSPIILSSKTNGGVSLYYTTNIVPSQYNQWYYGVRQVGKYNVDDKTMSSGTVVNTSTSGGVTMSNYNLNTDQLVADIIKNQGGIQTVYEAYAQAQMGDIMNSSGTAGHSRLVAIDPVVIRNGNGVIDPAKSYFVTHEQGDGLYERTTTNSSWRINYKYTFEQLAYQNTTDLTGSSGYYMPVSMDAFHETSVATTGGCSQTTDANGKKIVDPVSGMINSSFRVQCATVTIKDANGNVLYEKTAYQGTSASQSRRRAVPGSIPMSMSEFFSDYKNSLSSSGTYYFTVVATNFVGVTTTVVNNQAFEYSAA